MVRRALLLACAVVAAVVEIGAANEEVSDAWSQAFPFPTTESNDQRQAVAQTEATYVMRESTKAHTERRDDMGESTGAVQPTRSGYCYIKSIPTWASGNGVKMWQDRTYRFLGNAAVASTASSSGNTYFTSSNFDYFIQTTVTRRSSDTATFTVKAKSYVVVMADSSTCGTPSLGSGWSTCSEKLNYDLYGFSSARHQMTWCRSKTVNANTAVPLKSGGCKVAAFVKYLQGWRNTVLPSPTAVLCSGCQTVHVSSTKFANGDKVWNDRDYPVATCDGGLGKWQAHGDDFYYLIRTSVNDRYKPFEFKVYSEARVFIITDGAAQSASLPKSEGWERCDPGCIRIYLAVVTSYMYLTQCFTKTVPANQNIRVNMKSGVNVNTNADKTLALVQYFPDCPTGYSINYAAIKTCTGTSTCCQQLAKCSSMDTCGADPEFVLDPSQSNTPCQGKGGGTQCDDFLDKERCCTRKANL